MNTEAKVVNMEKSVGVGQDSQIFIYCEHCGKRIMERLPNGLFRFIFGKRPEDSGSPPVEILIHGSVKMRCLRRSCKKWNVINYLPVIFLEVDNKEIPQSDSSELPNRVTE